MGTELPGHGLVRHGGLARPELTGERAAALARHWGLDGELTELGSNQDRNYLVDGRHVLKVANAAASRAELEAQHLALAELASAGLLVPVPVHSAAGQEIERVDVSGVPLLTRVLTYVAGEPLAERADFGAAEARLLGSTAGAVVKALAGFLHPGTVRDTQWDLRAAPDVVLALVSFVSQEQRRVALTEACAVAEARLRPVAMSLPGQVIHGDITQDNVVLASDGELGVIDFGDLQVSWRVAELAVTCAGVLGSASGDQCALLLEAVRGFVEQVELTEAELAALWPLTVLRTAVLVVSGEQQVQLDAAGEEGGNDYADVRRAAEWQSFRLASAWNPDEVDALIRAAAADAPAEIAFGRLLPPDLTPAVVDLSVTSPDLDGGAWLDPDAERDILRAHAAGSGAAVTRWAEYRLTRAQVPAARGGSATLALGVDLVVPAGTRLHCPFGGKIKEGDNERSVALHGEHATLRLHGATVTAQSQEVRPGEAFAIAASGEPGGLAFVRVQLCTVDGDTVPCVAPPFLVTPRAEGTWRRLCPDPSPLVGVDVAAPPADPDGLLARRDAAFATVQEHYYRRPPQIERGWREYLVDTSAQAYIDVVNNVALLGHSHPRLIDAAARQWALLNTNSRFHYAAATELSERLAALAPAGLDTVFLVNSGSEAVDLALRLALTATRRPRILAAREAYHGWTIGSDAVSTSLGDNPRALESRPSWVELIDAPNAVRGTHRGASAGEGYLADLDAQLGALGEGGRAQLAGVIIEPIFGNGGGVLLPSGYLAGVYSRVRALGGLCISDEVQVGYGRLGEHFWGFEQQGDGAVPDIITVAKAMGNGQPLGAVITRSSIASAFAAEGSFFSSAGGSSVSARIGTVVLDVLADEGLQENARVVGSAFKASLESLAARHPSIGAVHGMGLYLGVELVTDRASFAPATSLAASVCEALLDEGCIVQPTGDHKNVLKVKPPLCITSASVTYVTGALDRVLTDLSA